MARKPNSRIGLDFIMELRPVTAPGNVITLDATEYESTASAYGVDELLTRRVSNVDLVPLIPVLVQAVKDLSDEVESLKAETLYLKQRTGT